MKRGVNWLQLFILLTIVLLATFSIMEADLMSEWFSQDNSGKLTLTIVDKPKASLENGPTKEEIH